VWESHEKHVVEYFNINKIDYNWQVQTFILPDGKPIHQIVICLIKTNGLKLKDIFAMTLKKNENGPIKNIQIVNYGKVKKLMK